MPLVKFWINAFIPFSVPGYTVIMPPGAHTGKSAIPRPWQARLWPGNTFTHTDVGFLTDQRSFDSTFGASARMSNWCEVETDYMVLTHDGHVSSGTTQVDLVTGAQTGFALANMSRCSFTPPPRPSASARGMPGAHFGAGRGGSTFPTAPAAVVPPASMAIGLVAAAGDPLVGAAADIDYNGTLLISIAVGGRITVAFNGLIDSFPAYDCYASCNGTTKTLFTVSPPTGNTVIDLLGPAGTPVSGSVSFP